jgi:hypothetical protein
MICRSPRDPRCASCVRRRRCAGQQALQIVGRNQVAVARATKLRLRVQVAGIQPVIAHRAALDMQHPLRIFPGDFVTLEPLRPHICQLFGVENKSPAAAVAQLAMAAAPQVC